MPIDGRNLIQDRYLVAVPIFNEEAYVSRVVSATRVHARHVLLVDDGSSDATPQLIAGLQGITVLTHATNMGYGRSLADAFAYAVAHDFEWLITMDCDEQHEPAAIPRFVTAIEENDADIVSGSRYLARSAGSDLPPPDRRAINGRITAMLNARLALSITDAFCGFKAYRVAALARMNITENGYAMPMQLWAQAAWLGLRVRELAVRLVYNDPTRHFGGSLDDPEVRYRHYIDVFEAEMTALQGAGRQEIPGGSGSGDCGRPGAERCTSS